jgi:hypothetical protein
MFDFQKSAWRRHSLIAAPLHDEFNADHDDNNDVLVTASGVPLYLISLNRGDAEIIRRRAMR